MQVGNRSTCVLYAQECYSWVAEHSDVMMSFHLYVANFILVIIYKQTKNSPKFENTFLKNPI